MLTLAALHRIFYRKFNRIAIGTLPTFVQVDAKDVYTLNIFEKLTLNISGQLRKQFRVHVIFSIDFRQQFFRRRLLENNHASFSLVRCVNKGITNSFGNIPIKINVMDANSTIIITATEGKTTTKTETGRDVIAM